jgi:hypothetical protein
MDEESRIVCQEYQQGEELRSIWNAHSPRSETRDHIATHTTNEGVVCIVMSPIRPCSLVDVDVARKHKYLPPRLSSLFPTHQPSVFVSHPQELS